MQGHQLSWGQAIRNIPIQLTPEMENNANWLHPLKNINNGQFKLHPVPEIYTQNLINVSAKIKWCQLLLRIKASKATDGCRLGTMNRFSIASWKVRSMFQERKDMPYLSRNFLFRGLHFWVEMRKNRGVLIQKFEQVASRARRSDFLLIRFG